MRTRILLANLHATSNPLVVVPWLIAQALTRRVDAILLQEATRGHRRLLRRLPRWTLVHAPGSDEALLARRRHLTRPGVITGLEATWRGKHTGQDHKARTIPHGVIRGWLTAVVVHFPPGWESGPQDRREAGTEYLDALKVATSSHAGSLALGGDWNALHRFSHQLGRFLHRHGLEATGRGIDYVATRNAECLRYKRIARAPGMDHDAVIVVLAPPTL